MENTRNRKTEQHEICGPIVHVIFQTTKSRKQITNYQTNIIYRNHVQQDKDRRGLA